VARFNFPTSLAADAHGNLYVADTMNQAIRRVVPSSGAVSTVVGVLGVGVVRLGPLPAAIDFPWAVAITAQGDLVLSCSENAVLIAHGL
jgi:hypothetical protein